MKKIKILASVCSLFILCSAFLFPAKAAEAVRDNGRGAALVCLLDASGSMRKNDRERLAIDSVSRLIYSLPSQSKAGVVAYNNGTVYKSRLLEEEERPDLVSAVSAIRYNGYTDAGKGLEDAVALLKGDASARKTIIILSDGGIERRLPKETEQSKEEFRRAVSEAVSLNITIHVIGLGNDMKDMDNEMYAAGTATGGIKLRIGTAGQLAEAVDEITRQSGVTAGEAAYTVDAGQEEGVLTIPFSYEGTARVRIVLSSDKSFDVLSVDAGTGEVTQNKGDLFTIIDIKNPPEGNITIRFRGENGNPVKADVLPEYDTVPRTGPEGAGSRTDVPAGSPSAAQPPRTGPEGAGSPSAAQHPRTSLKGADSPSAAQPPRTGPEGAGSRTNVPLPLAVLEMKFFPGAAIAILLMAAVLLLVLLRGSRMRKKRSGKPPGVLKLDIRGGRFGRKGSSLCYSLFCLRQQADTSLQTVLTSCGVEEAIGAGNIHFEIEKKDCLVLVNDSDFEVRYRQRKVAGGRKERIPLLSTVKIFVENADCGLVIKRLVIE